MVEYLPSIHRGPGFRVGWRKNLLFWYMANTLFFCFVLFCGTGVWTQGLHLEPFHWPLFVLGIFKIESHYLLRLALNLILLIPASWVPGITGMSHWCLAIWLILCMIFFLSIWAKWPEHCMYIWIKDTF
jgi:hypothetical protein